MNWKRPKSVAEGWTPSRHGIPSTYNRGCRCDECRAANAARQREHGYNRAARTRRLARRVEVDGRLVAPLPPDRHGRREAYNAHGCRCEPCTEASAVYQREWAARLGATS